MSSYQQEINKRENALNSAELQNWGPARSGTENDYSFSIGSDPWEGRNGTCGYGEEMDKLYVENAPVNEEIVKSHREWVDNRRAWSGVSKYLQESIPVVTDWRGIRLPQPTPQSCSRAELTEYGPADFTYFVGTQTKKLYDPVLNPQEMAGMFRQNSVENGGCTSGFSMYGF